MTTLPLPIRGQADTCTYCPKLCRFSCPVAEGESRETVTPWGLMSLLRMVDEGQVELTAEVGEVFFHCTGCLRCQTWCRHDNDLPTAMRHARRMVVDSGLPAPEALRSVDTNMQQFGAPYGAVPELPAAAAAVFDDTSDVVYFPGCARRREDPEGVILMGKLLAEVLGRRVALFQGDGAAPVHCCGGSLTQAGFGASAELWRGRMSRMLSRFDLVVTECGEMELDDEWPRVEQLVDLLFQRLTAWMGRTTEAAGSAPFAGEVVLHDGCRSGRRLQLHDATRAVVTAAIGRPPQDMWLARDEALCCGAGDHYPLVSPKGAAAAADLVIGAATDQSGQVLVTASPRCASHLRASAGEAVEVMDVGRLVAATLGLGTDGDSTE